GNVVANQTVVWSAGTNSSVSGTLTGTTTTAGIATFPGIWTAGPTNGLTATLIATVQGTSLTQTFSSLIAGPPASIAVSAGNGQTAAVNAAVTTAPAVILKDAAGNPVVGTSVTFAVTAGGGSVTGATPTTDSIGVAKVTAWTLGSVVGS